VSDNASFCGECGEHLDPQYPPGWYPNSDHAGRVEFWDGSRWATPPQQPQISSQSLIPRTTADALLSRRKTWTGTFVKAIHVHPTDPHYGHHFRVTNSWRDPDTDQWWIGWHPTEDDFGAEPPPGEPIYIFDGTTWDLPAVPKTVFPYFTAILCLIGAVAVWPIDIAMHGDAEMAYLVTFFCMIQPFVTWFQKVEPVRYTKVVAVYMAASAAHSAYRHRSDARANEINQQVRDFTSIPQKDYWSA
jgi:hypothetical protein